MLILPAVFMALVWAARWIYFLFSDLCGPDLTEIERRHHENDKKIRDREQKGLEKINKERDELKDGIDRGDPSPAEIFNRELDDE